MNQEEVGFVISSRDFLVYLDGLPTIRINDMVESEAGLRGWVTSLFEDSVEVLMVDEGEISVGQTFKKLPSRLGVSVGDFLLGRSINPLGVPIDGKGPLTSSKTFTEIQLDQKAPGIESRQFIQQQFITGITLIDSLIPIGKGQRELILGDAHSGKTQTLIDIIINQKGTGVVCIYASIGQPSVKVRGLINVLKANNALEYTVVIATSSSEGAPLIFLTPKTALAVAGYFQKRGKNVLVILDDLGSHAKIYREIALLSNKSPGKQSYPGDIFYQHAHLLELAGNFLPKEGGGSITALPVMEFNISDFTTLIPTNLISMTDGHLLFKSSLRSQGQIPAIDISLSVSRVGRQTQDRVSNLLYSRVRQVLSQAQDFETISRFSSELSAETQLILKRKDFILEILKQEPFSAISKPVQIILLALPFTSFLQNEQSSSTNKDKNFISEGKNLFIEKYKKILIDAFTKNPKLSLIAKNISKMKTDEELIRQLESVEPILAKLCP